MNRLSQYLLIATLIVSSHLSAATAYKAEIPFQRDGRNWELGYHARDNGSYIEEYVLQGQNTDNWDEMVVIQGFDEKQSVEEHLGAFDANLKKQLPPGTYNYKVLYQDEQTALVEWWMDESALDDAESSLWEVFRVMVTPEDKYLVLRYISKNLDPVDPIRQRFADILASVELAEEELDLAVEGQGAIRNDAYAFAIDYPENWQYSIVSSNGEAFIFSLGAPGQQGLLQVQVMHPQAFMSEDEVAAAYEAFKTGEVYRDLYQSSETIDLGEFGSVEVVTLHHTMEEWELEERLMVITKEGRTVWFSLVTPVKEDGDMVQRLLDIVRSYRFTQVETN